MKEQCSPFTGTSVHSEFLSTAPFVGSLETKYASARSGEWDSCLFPSWILTLSLSPFWENQISFGFQKYLSWSIGRIPWWWESTISKKAENKSDDTDVPGNCMTPVAKGRPRPSVASLFSWGPSGKDLTWRYSKRKPIKVQWELQCFNLNYQWNQHSVAMPEGWRSGKLIFIPIKYIKMPSLLKEHLKLGDQ